jgi:hypothetical protein
LQFKLAEDIISQFYPKEASDFLETLRKINRTILHAEILLQYTKAGTTNT